MRLYESLYLPLLSAAPPWSTRDIKTRPFLPVFTVAPCEDSERCEEGCTRRDGSAARRDGRDNRRSTILKVQTRGKDVKKGEGEDIGIATQNNSRKIGRE